MPQPYMLCKFGVVCRGTTPSHELSEPRRKYRAAIGHVAITPISAWPAASHRFLRDFSCLKEFCPIRLDHRPPHICVTSQLDTMSVTMEQQGTTTSTVSNVQIPGVPSDASILNSLRNVFRREELQKRRTSSNKAQASGVRVKVNAPTPTTAVRELDQARPEMEIDTDE